MRLTQHLKPRPTGMQIVQAAGLRCVIGAFNGYNWEKNYVMLTHKVAFGTDCRSTMCAYHEVAHSQQPRPVLALASIWMGVRGLTGARKWVLVTLLAFLWPVYLWAETDAWQKVVGSD